MSTVFSILAGLSGLGSLVLGILVLIKLFQAKGALHGILGLICMLYTFIWGWMTQKDYKVSNIPVMVTWTGLIVAGIVLNLLAGVFAASSESGMLLRFFA